MLIKNYLLETRPQFLVLSLVLAILGSGIALASGSFNLGWAVLLFVGLLFLHISANTLNDYFDYRSGIDLATNRTPFSGGSGVLPSGALSPRAVLVLGLTTFVLAIPIGLYFISIRGMALLPLFFVGAVLVLLYTTLFTKIGGGMSEITAGLGLGTLPVFGIYYIMTGNAAGAAIYASIPSGFLVAKR